jgi:hypothetical protein
MTKEEIKEMIDATINENGERNITGKTLNLALNAIVDAMGEGGGVETIYMVPEFMNPDESDLDGSNSPYSKERIMEIIEHNATVYSKIANMYKEKNQVIPVCVDYGFAYTFTGIFGGGSPGALATSTIMANVSATMTYGNHPYYMDDEVAVVITPCEDAAFGFVTHENSFLLLPNGICGFGTWRDSNVG